MDQNILKRVIDTYGIEHQERKCFEEVGEFLQAINKVKDAAYEDREKYEYEKQHLQEEIADCLIVFHQMRLIYGPEAVDRFVIDKLARLEDRLDEIAMRKSMHQENGRMQENL